MNLWYFEVVGVSYHDKVQQENQQIVLQCENFLVCEKITLWTPTRVFIPNNQTKNHEFFVKHEHDEQLKYKTKS